MSGLPYPGARPPHADWGPGPVPERSAEQSTRTPTNRVRTLPIRVEFLRQISQWRVRGVLLVLGLLPIVIRLAFLIGGGRSDGGTDLASLAQTSGTTFTAFVLVVTGGFLLTLVIAILYGDMIAGEASRSTLKYLLTIPVSRARLLLVKVIVSFSVFGIGLVLLAGMSLLVGIVSYGPGGLQTPAGPQLGLGDSLLRIAAATAVIPVQLLWAAALGTLFTVVTDAPLGAAGGVVITSIVSSILGRVEDLADFRSYLPTWNQDAFGQFFLARVDLAPLADSVLGSLTYALIFGVIAVWWFQRKNITS